MDTEAVIWIVLGIVLTLVAIATLGVLVWFVVQAISQDRDRNTNDAARLLAEQERVGIERNRAGMELLNSSFVMIGRMPDLVPGRTLTPEETALLERHAAIAKRVGESTATQMEATLPPPTP